MSYNTGVQYLVETGQRQFDVSIPYLDRNDIKVSVNGVAQPVTWISDSRFDLGWQPNANSVVEIRRVTPISQPKVEFNDGSNLTERELNDAVRQLLFHEQETSDTVTGAIDRATIRLGDQLGVVTSPDAIVDELLRTQYLGEDLVNRLRDTIAAYDLQAASIVDHAIRLNQQASNTALLTSTISNVTATVSQVNGRVDTLQGVIDGLLDVGNGEGIGAVIANESSQRIAGDTALADTISLIGARSGNSQAFIVNTGTVRVSPTETLADRFSAINANSATTTARIATEEQTRANAVAVQAGRTDLLTTRMGSAEANIVSEQTARQNADTALASTLALIGVTRSGNSGFILDSTKVYMSQNETLVQRHNAMIAQAVTTAGTAAQALVQTETNARITANGVITSALTGHNSRLGSVESGLASEITTRANQNEAQTTAREALASTVAANLAAAISNEQSTRATAISAEATARQQLATIVGQNTTAIQNEVTARSTADSSFASQLALMGAANPGGTAWILDLTKVQVGGGVSLGTRLSGIDTAAGNNAAAIANEITARSDAVSAVAQSLSTLTSTVNGHTSSITTLAQVTNGLNARYTMAVNSNGHIAGMIFDANPYGSGINFVADEMGFTAPNGGSPIKIMSIADGKVVFNGNVRINGDLLVTGTINGDRMVENTVSSIVVGANNASVILTNNTPTRIHGLNINVARSNSPIEIDFNAWGTFLHNDGGSFIAYVDLVRVSPGGAATILQTIPIYGSGMANDVWQGAIPVKWVDFPGATGTHHYYVQIYFNVSNMTTQQVTARFGKLEELKTVTASSGTGTGSGPGTGSGGGTGGGGGSGGGTGGGGLEDPGGGGGGYEEPTMPTVP